MPTLIEHSASHGTYSARRYELDVPDGNSTKTLFALWHHAGNQAQVAPDGWAVIVGEWEAQSFVRCSKELLTKVENRTGEAPAGASISGGSVDMRLRIINGWRLYVDFPEQTPEAVSNGSPSTWHIAPGEFEAACDLLACLALLDHCEPRKVAEVGHSWLLPRGVCELQEAADVSAQQLRALQSEVDITAQFYSTLDDEARLPILRVIDHARDSLAAFETARCNSCGGEFVRETSARWKTDCRSCYFAKIPTPPPIDWAAWSAQLGLATDAAVPNAGKPWKKREEARLRARWCESQDSLATLVQSFGRSPAAIVARLVKLGIFPDANAACSAAMTRRAHDRTCGCKPERRMTT